MPSRRIVHMKPKLKTVTHGRGQRSQSAFVPYPIPTAHPSRFSVEHDVVLPVSGADSTTPVSATVSARKSYYERKATEIAEWAAIRDAVGSVQLSLNAPISSRCSCSPEVECENPIRCLDCGPFKMYCDKCESAAHRNVLHRPEIWNVSFNLKKLYHFCLDIGIDVSVMRMLVNCGMSQRVKCGIWHVVSRSALKLQSNNRIKYSLIGLL